MVDLKESGKFPFDFIELNSSEISESKKKIKP